MWVSRKRTIDNMHLYTEYIYLATTAYEKNGPEGDRWKNREVPLGPWWLSK